MPYEEQTQKNYVFLNEEQVSWYKNLLNKQNKRKLRNVYCVNCGEKGHVVKDCNGPITSFGIIAFRLVKSEEDEIGDTNVELNRVLSISKAPQNSPKRYPTLKYLMIQRKDTMGYIDFVRGKYAAHNKDKMIGVCLEEMTLLEKHNLVSKSFDQIWSELWINHESKTFKNEYESAKEKFQRLDITSLVDTSVNHFDFQEFGFPKGRRNMKESNIVCAEREFFEETGYNKGTYKFLKNYPTVDEEFTGTNGIRYRHIYYVVKMNDDITPPKIDKHNIVQTGEVQNIGWFTIEECMTIIRPYDTAKKQAINNVNSDLLRMGGDFVVSSYYYADTPSSPSPQPHSSSNRRWNSFNNHFPNYRRSFGWNFFHETP
jgi:8-oxo-dGTP pyrophosphatase MutT (NUDIX family)